MQNKALVFSFEKGKIAETEKLTDIQWNSFAIFLGILVLTFSNLSIIFDGAKKVTSYQCNESKRQEQERGH